MARFAFIEHNSLLFINKPTQEWLITLVVVNPFHYAFKFCIFYLLLMLFNVCCLFYSFTFDT